MATVLRAAVTEHDWSSPLPALGPLVAGRDLRLLHAAAVEHGVDSFVYLSLRGLDGVDPLVTDSLGESYRSGAVGHVRALADLDGLAAALPAGVRWLVFKGPVIAETLYSRPDLRRYGDLDVLVARSAFGDAVAALERSGLRIRDANWTLLGREQRAQLHVVLPLGTPADVHWHLVNRGAVRRTFSVPEQELFARARTTQLDGRSVATLHPVDTLLHLCLHAALPGGRRLLWLKDIERAIVVARPDWGEVVTEARRWRVAAIVAAMLQRVSRTLGAAVPAGVLAALAPAGLRRAVVNRAARSWALEARPASSAPTPLLLPSLRDSWPATAAAAAARLSAGGPLGPRLARRASILAGGSLLPDGPAVFQPAGGEGARSAYLRAVQRGAAPRR